MSHRLLLTAVLYLLWNSCVVLSQTDNEKLTLINERLTSAVEADSKRCDQTDWKQKYNDLHKNVLSSPKPKLLVAVPHLSGLADRIVGMTSTLMMAILTDRAFQIGRRGKLPVFESAFHAPNFNWTRGSDPDWLIEPLKEKANPENYNGSVLASKEYFAVNTIENYRLQDSFLRQDLVPILGGDALTTMLVSNRGKTIRMFENQHYAKRLQDDMKLTPYTAFGCLLNYAVQPKSDIFLPMYEQFVQMTNPDPSILRISIQVRAGDSVWGTNAHTHNPAEAEGVLNGVSRFFSCAEQIEKFVLADNPDKYKSVLWYLATDSRALRHAAVARYGTKVVTNPHSHLEHSAKEQSVCQAGEACTVSDIGFTTAAAEWWLLGYADYHVITLYSGFGRSGAFRTLTTDRIYTVHQKEVQCNRDSFSSLETLMYDWAGI